MNPKNHNLDFVEDVASDDCAGLKKAFVSYGDSWKKRGGVSAFMMLSRKWDRLERQCEAHKYDIFDAIRSDKRAEGIIDDIRDLRRYLTLVEAEMRLQGVESAVSVHRDNHAGNPEKDIGG